MVVPGTPGTPGSRSSLTTSRAESTWCRNRLLVVQNAVNEMWSFIWICSTGETGHLSSPFLSSWSPLCGRQCRSANQNYNWHSPNPSRPPTTTPAALSLCFNQKVHLTPHLIHLNLVLPDRSNRLHHCKWSMDPSSWYNQWLLPDANCCWCLSLWPLSFLAQRNE